MPDFVTSPDGVQIGYFTQGSGPPLLMLHGGGNDHSFAPELTDLLAVSHTVVKPDRRGRGASGDHIDYHIEREADDLISVLKTFNEPPILFANSFGGFVTVEALARALPELKRIVLFEPPLQRERDEAIARNAHHMKALVDAERHQEALVFHQTMFHLRSASEVQRMQQDERGWMRRLQAVGTNAREMLFLHDKYAFDAARLRDPGCPVEVLVGDETIPFLRKSARLLSAVPFVQTRVLQGLTHSGPTTHPELIARIILAEPVGSSI